MNTITTRMTAFGITGAAATALIIGGVIAPAQADDTSTDTRTSTSSDSSTDSSQSQIDLINDLFNVGDLDATGNGVLGNDTNLGGVANGGVLNGGVVDGPLVEDSLTSDVGDVASGNETANGNAIGSGNDTPIASGNDVTAPVDAPVTAPVDAPVGSGNDSDLGGTNVDDIGTDVEGLVDDITGDLDLGGLLGR